MPKRDEPSMGHFLGLGLQVAIGVGLGLWAGSWLDRRFGWTPWGTLVCVMLGMAGGMYLMIKEAIRANRD
jgi:F0F1-type ATP synthase assembly protein I